MTDILVFGAHPDDAEFGMGGTLVKLRQEGKSIALCVLTKGQSGTFGTTDERVEEMKKAASILGATIDILNYKDCELEDTPHLRKHLATVIRTHAPPVIYSTPYNINGSFRSGIAHPDHIALGSAVRFAARLARFANVSGVEGKPHKINALLYYMTSDNPDVFVDVSEHKESFLELIQAHKSQLQIKDGKIIEYLLERRATLGTKCGTQLAEGFTSADPLPVDIDYFLESQIK